VATYRLSVSTISRSSGRSAVAAAAYRAGVCLVNERDGHVHNYRNRAAHIAASGILAPEHAPEWAQDRARLWNAAEAAEGRKNSVTAREIQLSLPHELDDRQRLVLVRAFAKKLVERYGVVADYAIHRPDAKGDARNHHAHVMLTTRRMGRDGLEEKTRELDDRSKGKDGSASRGSAEVEFLRQYWCALENQMLDHAKSAERVDHRSYQRQGVEKEPEPRLGHEAHALEQAGQQTPLKAIWRDAVRRGDRETAQAAALAYHVRQSEQHAAKPEPVRGRSPKGRRWTYEQPPRLVQGPAHLRFNQQARPVRPKSLPLEVAKYLDKPRAKTWQEHYKRQREAAEMLEKRHQWEREQVVQNFVPHSPPANQNHRKTGLSRLFSQASDNKVAHLDEKKRIESLRAAELARLAVKQEAERQALLERDKVQRRAIARDLGKGGPEKQRGPKTPDRFPQPEREGMGGRSMADERRHKRPG
jgi:hypothetical protein